jgi:hypothetical protein
MLVLDTMLLLAALCRDMGDARHGVRSWLLRARREEARLLNNNYNNSSNPPRGTDQLCGAW